MTEINQHLKAIHEIINKVDRLVLDAGIMERFTGHIERFFKMVEDYGEALQPYIKKLEKARRRIKRDKNPERFAGKCLNDICPPPKGWVKMDYLDNNFVKVDMSVIYRPAEPVNPLLWLGIFGNASLQRKPGDDEKLMCEYVRLAVIHDYELRYSGTPTDTPILSIKYEGKWFKRDDFCKGIWEYYHYPNQEPNLLYYPATAQEKLSCLERAFERVKTDLASKQKNGGEAKKTKITKEEANIRARVLIKENPSITARQLAEKIPCSLGLIPHLPVWKALQDYKKETFGGKKPKIVPFTKGLEYMLGTNDDKVNQLIADQEGEQREDARQPRLYLSHNRKPKRSNQ